MSINGVNYNSYLYTAYKAVNNSCASSAFTNPIRTSNNNSKVDSVQFTSTTQHQGTKLTPLELRRELADTKSKQGLIGKLWDGFKNLTHVGAGSAKAEKAIKDFESGKISQEEANKAVMGYKEGQKQCVDMVADIVSGIAAFGAFAFATGVGIAASPFTGGASLGLVAAGFAIAGTAGSATKVLVKGLDCAVGGRKYDSLGYDLATGGVNGMFAPITAGIGGAAGKAVAGKVGVAAVSEGGEVILKETLEGTTKGVITKTLLTTNVSYTGGTAGARALALGIDMAVNGTISGAVDSGTRYLAGDSENKSLKGFVKEVGIGAASGFVLAPAIGGGMRLAGNGIGNVTGKLQSKVATNYSQAKTAMMNTPVVENPDMEVLRGFGGILKQTQDLVNGAQTRGSELLDGLDKNILGLSEDVSGILKSASAFNTDLIAISNENKALIVEILDEISTGKDVSSKVAELAQKGISLTDVINNKFNTLSNEIEEKLAKIMVANETLTQKAETGIEFASQTLDNAGLIANETIEQVKRIPETDAYKQLGDLPEKVKNLYNSLLSDASALDNTAQVAKEKIANGNVKDGLEDLAKYYDELDAFNTKLNQDLSSVESSVERSGIKESADILRERITKLTSSADFQNMSREEQIQALMENSNILFSKFAQTFSSNDGLPADVQKIFKQFTSNCTVSRTIPQAQNLTDELYGAGKYTIKKSFGAGTIGETYLAQTADGTEVVIKMLKEGVTPEKFAQDRAMFTKYINEFVTDATEKEYKLNLINNMFDAWNKELDFALEAQGAKAMAEGAKRFSVAQTLEIGSKQGQNISLIMEKANGVKLDTLLEMIRVYNQNPSEYFARYARVIEEYPILKTPDVWKKDLVVAYQKAQNEQVMFVGKQGTRTVHADPHPGNVFVDFDATTGKPKIIYIDAGNVIERTNSQTLKDIALSLNMMIGNSKGIADAMLEGAILPSGANKAEISQKFAQLLDERLYKAGVNLKSTQYTQNTINGIMKELNTIADSNNSNLMKATLQRIETSRAINSACGTSLSKKVDINDLALGIIKSFRVNPSETWQTIKPIMKWAYENNDQAMITFFQMIMTKVSTQNVA